MTTMMNDVLKRHRSWKTIVLALSAIGFFRGERVSAGDAVELLRRVQTIPLEGVEGRMDHMTLDAAGRTLYLAALANNTLEVVDLQAGRRVRQIKDIQEPQGVVRHPKSNTLVLTSGEDGRCRFLDSSMNIVAEVDELPDADNVRYDPAADRVYVAYGEGGLAVIDAHSRKKIGDIPLAGHPESFQLGTKDRRIFVNVPSARHVAVVDRESRKTIATWPITKAAKNYPMALDEDHHRLFIGCREPAQLVVFDTAAGHEIQNLGVCGDADDIFVDHSTGRIYVSGGEGCISVMGRKDSGDYQEIARIPSAPGARTSLFVPETRRLYLAVPHRGDQPAIIWVYEIVP